MTLSRGTIMDIVRFSEEGCAFDSIPPEVVTVSKEIIVNAAAVGLAGAAQKEADVVTAFAQEMGGNGRCTIIGKGLRTSPVYAALANGLMIHLLDFDDEIIATGSHTGSAILPVVMALGEMDGIPGKDVLSAFVLGCEVASKLGNYSSGDEGSRAFSAAAGAAAAAARLLELNHEQFAQALLLAGERSFASAATLLPGPGRAYRQGQAAMAGLVAAVMVKRGLMSTIAQGIPVSWDIEGRAERLDDSLVSVGPALGRPFDVMDPGVSLKIYPCVSQSHTAIDAALQLIQQYRVTADDIVSVQVSVTPKAMNAAPFPTPADGWQSRRCLSFIVASALCYGHPLIDNFTDAAVNDGQIRSLMDRVSVEATEQPLGAMPYSVSPYPASIEVVLRDGRRLQHRVEFARGHPELPLSPEELDAKFLYCSRYILPPDHIEESIIRLRDLENIENTTGIFSVLGG